MKIKVSSVGIIALIITSCTGSKEELNVVKSENASDIRKKERNPTNIIVEVDGIKLTRGELDMQVYNRIAYMKDRMSPEEYSALEKNLENQLVEQFITTQVLINEANRQKINVNDNEIKSTFEKYRSLLPPELSIESIISPSTPAEIDIRKRIEETVKIDKLIYSVINTNITVSEEEIAEFTNRYKEQIATLPETYHVRHIQISIPDSSEETMKEKFALAQKIREEIINGADFAEMAKKYSCCHSRETGGDLGFLALNNVIPQFANIISKQKIGEIGPVVYVTNSGYHIVQVLEHQQAGTLSKEQIITLIKKEKINRAFDTYINELKTHANIKDLRK